MTLTVGSLFAGIGGFDLGFERAGFEIRWQVEIDPFCRAVLAKHWPHVRRYEDVRTVGAELAAVDVLCGGFPCQPHSLAGRRAAAADERDLWPEFRRLICELEPRWVVAENVPGILSSDAGRFFGDILRDLAACGYDAEWDCLPASAFGAPHRRDRVWIVAYPNGRRQQERAKRDGDTSQDTADRDSCGRHADRSCDALADAADGLRRAHGRGVENGEGPCSREARKRSVWQGDGRTWNDGFAASGSVESSADADSGNGYGRRGDVQMGRIWCAGATSRDVYRNRTQWGFEPDVGRVAHGIPARVDRLRGLGNAIVPQIAEWIASRILDAETRSSAVK